MIPVPIGSLLENINACSFWVKTPMPCKRKSALIPQILWAQELTDVSLNDIFCLKYKLNLYHPPTKKLILHFINRNMFTPDMLKDFIVSKRTLEGQKENLDIVLKEANKLVLCKQLMHVTPPYCFLRSPPETAHDPLGPVGIIPWYSRLSGGWWVPAPLEDISAS